jgi:transposase
LPGAESIRLLHTVRSGAVKARTACINELQALLITAPAQLREHLAGGKGAKLVQACARLQPDRDLTDPIHSARYALRRLAERWQQLTAEITDLDARLTCLVKQARPDLLQITGVGVETAAQLLSTCGDNPDRLHSEAAFASLCGVSPVPASSGKTIRHRAQPRRRPASQPSPVRDRRLPPGLRRTYPRLPATPHRRRTVQEREHPLPHPSFTAVNPPEVRAWATTDPAHHPSLGAAPRR